ncbi:unnamed protein product [Adineta steineri]|uniref:RRM domain-containing protein n=3 Tax=Adineta steineri TaxID=433720 RepID=A0A818X938_9BILA|nr:unnamed protein product [Adineta steineri]
MSKANGNNRISALKRLGKSSSINNINHRQTIGLNNSSVKDARELLINRTISSTFDSRQMFNRQSSQTFNTMPTNIIVRNTEDINNNNEKMVVVTGLKDMKMKDGRLIQAATTDNNQSGKKKQIFAVGQSTFVTIRNNNNSNNNNNINFSSNQSTEKLSFTKTITNTSVNRNDDNDNTQTTNTFSSLSNQKVVIKVVNDKYQEAPKPIQISTTTTAVPTSSHLLYTRHNSPPLIKRLHDVSIQTTPPPSSSRSPIRINSHRRLPSTHIVDEDEHISDRSMNEDFYEPPVKRTSSSSTSTSTTRKPSNTEKEQQSTFTPVSTGSTKRSSTGAPVNSKPTSQTSTTSKPISTTQSQTTAGTVLVTNLVPSVTEEDVFELFGQIGRINEIITLSPGCVQIVFAKREDGEQAVSKYHNRLLDGQFMYVSLQRTAAAAAPSPPVNQTPKSSNNIPQPPAKENPSSTTQQPSKSNPASKTTNITSQPPAKENGSSTNSSSTTTNHQPLKFNTTSKTSSKSSLDPAFIRQALFHPSNNSTNPVQFQVKL